MSWHWQKETSVGSAGGLKFDRYQGESSRGFFNPTFGMSSPRAATSVATRKVLFPLAFRSTSPQKTGIWQLNNQRIGLKPVWSPLGIILGISGYMSCHSWHTSFHLYRFHDVWISDMSWSCNSPRLWLRSSWKWTMRFLAPFAPDRIREVFAKDEENFGVGVCKPLFCENLASISYTSLQKHDIVKVNREKGVQVDQTPAFGPGQKHEMAIFQPPLVSKSKVKVSEVTLSILMYSS